MAFSCAGKLGGHSSRLSSLRLPTARLTGYRLISQSNDNAGPESTKRKLASEAASVPSSVIERGLKDIPGPKYGLFKTIMELRKRGGFLEGILQYDRDLQKDFGNLVYKKHPTPQVSVYDAEIVAQIIHAADRSKNFANRPVAKLIADVLKDNAKVPGLFFSNGEDWYKLRKVLSKKMLRPISIVAYVSEIDEICTEAIETIRRERASPDKENSFEIAALDHLLFRWAFENVASVLFGKKFGTLGESQSEETLDFINSVGSFLVGIMNAIFIPRGLLKYYKPKPYKDFENAFMKMFYYCELFAGKRIKELQEGKEDGDVSDSLLLYLLANPDLTVEDVYTAMVDVFFAGVDTTSNTMLWVLYNITKKPHVLQRLRLEIDEKLAGKQQLKSEDLTQLPYLKACVKETLRLHTVVPVQQRVLEHDLLVLGYNVPAGTEFTLQAQTIGRMKEYFDDPEEFKPERWLSENNPSRYHPYATLPFGHGTRMCAGRRIAELELHMMIIKLLQNFDLTLCCDVKEKCRGVTIPDRPLQIKFVDRTDR